MRLAAALLTVAFLAASLAACGSSDSESTGEPGAPAGAAARGCVAATSPATGLRVTAASCGEAQRLALAWRRGENCQPGAGASRAGCSVGSYRCSAVRSDRGVAVNCTRPGHTVAFIVPRGG